VSPEPDSRQKVEPRRWIQEVDLQSWSFHQQPTRGRRQLVWGGSVWRRADVILASKIPFRSAGFGDVSGSIDAVTCLKVIGRTM